MTRALLTDKQLRNIQAIGERGMNIRVDIHPRAAQTKDPDHPYGDEIIEYGTVVSVKGWLVTKPTERLDAGGGEVRTISTHQLRVPVGTVIKAGDRVTVGTETFVVTDATNEQSWPEWTIAYLRGYNDE